MIPLTNKNVLRFMLCCLFFIVSIGTTAFASFKPLDSISFGPNEFGGNYDDVFKDNGIKFKFEYTTKGVSPQLIIKNKKNVVFTQPVTSLGKYYSMTLTRIQDADTGRIFYIAQRVYGGPKSQETYSYLLGYDSTTGTWKKYVDIKNYYSPILYGFSGMTIRYGKLTLYHFGRQYHSYTLTWNDAKQVFDYTDNGVVDNSYFNSALVYNRQYRPVYAHMDSEIYLDINSINTLEDTDSRWIFTATSYSTIRNSDVLPRDGHSIKAMVDKVNHRAWSWNEEKQQWVELPMHSVPYGYQMPSCIAINWAYQHRYGTFLGNLGGVMTSMAQNYKGN